MNIIVAVLYEKEETKMPFIDSKIAGKVSDAQKENIKTRLGKIISLLNKPETYLMVGFEDKFETNK